MAVVCALAATAGAAPASAAPAPRSSAAALDRSIASSARDLTAGEIRSHDVTSSDRGQRALARAGSKAGGLDVNSRSYRVYVFGDAEYVVTADTPLRVRVGRDAARQVVYDVTPYAKPAGVAAHAGWAIPPSSAWRYNNDSSFSETVGTWQRTIWWTMTKANDWKACSTCTAYDYWRLHGKERAAALTGSSSNEGFKRAWLEFDRGSGWSTVASFESDRPEESYGGVANQTTTVGFGSSFGINIGVPPLTGSGSVETSYGGSMTKSSENWHPVIRSEIGSGGVQWCRYESAEFTGTKVVATRVGVRISSSGTNGGWGILRGQQDTTSNCPSQI
jgi:hypothetical protein